MQIASRTRETPLIHVACVRNVFLCTCAAGERGSVCFAYIEDACPIETGILQKYIHNSHKA